MHRFRAAFFSCVPVTIVCQEAATRPLFNSPSGEQPASTSQIPRLQLSISARSDDSDTKNKIAETWNTNIAVKCHIKYHIYHSFVSHFFSIRAIDFLEKTY